MRRCLQPPVGAALARTERHREVLPVLETERLRLEPSRLEDWPLWRELLTGADAHYLGGPLREDAAFEAFGLAVGNWLLHGFGLWSIRDRTDRRLLGFIPFGLEWEDQEPELGWMLARTARGQGIAEEAARAGLAFAQEIFGAGGVVSYTDSHNTPSNRLAQRLGAERDQLAEAAIGAGVHVWRHGAEAGA